MLDALDEVEARTRRALEVAAVDVAACGWTLDAAVVAARWRRWRAAT